MLKKNGYDSWENLLDSSYLIFSPQKPQYSTGQKEQIDANMNNLFSYLSFIKNLINTCSSEYEFLNNSNGYHALSNFFHTNVLKDYSTTSVIYQKTKLLIDFMINAYMESPVKNKEFKDILNYALLEKNNPIYKENLSINAMKKLKIYLRHNNLTIYGFDESQDVQIQDTLSIENMNNHNEIILILNSVKDKINIMAKSYEIIENNKKDNTYLNIWLSNYENFVSLSAYDEWVATDVNKYQRMLSQYYNGFFNLEEHKKALEYLDCYQNNKYGKIVITGTRSEVLEKINISPSTCQDCILDIDKAEKIALGDISTHNVNQNYEFIFYYIIH